MARRRKEQQDEYRLPTYHAPSNRWRLRIQHAHGEKVAWWPATGPGTPSPEVVRDSTDLQDEWREIQKNWPTIRAFMAHYEPEKDWTRPVWINRRAYEGYVARKRAELKRGREEDRRNVLQHVARHGLSDLIGAASTPGALDLRECDYPQIREEAPELLAQVNAEGERRRLQVLSELAPARKRRATSTVRQAVARYLGEQKERVQLVCGNWIKGSTYTTARCNLLGVFGLSTASTEHPIRDPAPPIHLDALLPPREHLEALARYWHRMPEGIGSTRTVRNYLSAGRTFWNWCAARYDFDFPEDVARLYTAANVETPAEEWNPARIKTILASGKARGGERLKMYTLLGLLNGYGQTDCCEIKNGEYFREGEDRFTKRFRSKEGRPKRGSRPLRIKHWIAPELGEIIDRNRGTNPEGYLFNSERGTVLTADAVTGVWERAVEDAEGDLTFKQLRKLGYNRIKHHAESREVAELWDGHSGGIANHYDDGIFLPVIDAQRRFAEELREHGILDRGA